MNNVNNVQASWKSHVVRRAYYYGGAEQAHKALQRHDTYQGSSPVFKETQSESGACYKMANNINPAESFSHLNPEKITEMNRIAVEKVVHICYSLSHITLPKYRMLISG